MPLPIFAAARPCLCHSSGRDHEVLRAQATAEALAQRIPRSRCQHYKISSKVTGPRFQFPADVRSCNVYNALADDFHARSPGLFEQQTIQSEARKNSDLTIQVERDSSSRWRDQFAVADPITLDRSVAQKWPTLQRFVGESAAAGFFPRQLFVEKQDCAPSTCQFRGGKSAGRTASHN